MSIENLIEPQKNQLEEIIENVQSKSFILKPYDESIVNFFSDFSNNILTYPTISDFPEILALGYWLRKANIKRMIQEVQQDKNHIITPRGIAFHIAPANVDTIFIYSWALSLLCGNANILRVTQNRNAQVELLLHLLKTTLLSSKWSIINDFNYIITYPHDANISGLISRNSDIRIIWGGDETINSIRSLPSKPTTKDVAFADKFSYCIIKSDAYLEKQETASQIAHLFYNDAYMFNQMACSSTRIVYFIGETAKNETASDLFWKGLENELEEKKFNLTPDLAMNKLIEVYNQAVNKVEHQFVGEKNFAAPTVLRLEKAIGESGRLACGGGFFYEIFLNDLNNLTDYVNANDQTITYFGFSLDELYGFVNQNNGRGINRVVKIGEAMNFSPSWDGFQLLNEFTSKIYLS